MCTITHLIAAILVCVFAALSLVHVYWAAGGTWGVDAAVPERPKNGRQGVGDGKTVKAFEPSRGSTLLVAAALTSVAVLVSLRGGVFAPAITHWSVEWAIAVSGLVLLLRAIGDFNLVGFFKRIRGSAFARMDTWFYSPLCVLLGIGLLNVAFSAACA